MAFYMAMLTQIKIIWHCFSFGRSLRWAQKLIAWRRLIGLFVVSFSFGFTSLNLEFWVVAEFINIIFSLGANLCEHTQMLYPFDARSKAQTIWKFAMMTLFLGNMVGEEKRILRMIRGRISIFCGTKSTFGPLFGLLFLLMLKEFFFINFDRELL